MESSLSSSIIFSLSAWRNPEENAEAPHKGKIALVEFGFVGALLLAPIEMLVFAILTPLTALLYPISRTPMDWAIRGVTSSAMAIRFGLSGLVNNIARDRLPASEAEARDLYRRDNQSASSVDISDESEKDGSINGFSWKRLAGGNEHGFEGLSQQEKEDLADFDNDTLDWFATVVIYRLAYGDMTDIQVPRGQLPQQLVEGINRSRVHINMLVIPDTDEEWNSIKSLEQFNAYKNVGDAIADDPLPPRIRTCYNAFKVAYATPENARTWCSLVHLQLNPSP